MAIRQPAMTAKVKFKVGDHFRWNSEAGHVNSARSARSAPLSIHGDSASGPLLLLTAIFVLALTMTSPAVVAALRISAK